jgi:hypothetical protein
MLSVWMSINLLLKHASELEHNKKTWRGVNYTGDELDKLQSNSLRPYFSHRPIFGF